MPYILSSPGGAYHSLHGWTRNKKAALRFRTKEDAEQHREKEGLIGALTERVPDADLPPGVTDGAMAIFGYRGANG